MHLQLKRAYGRSCYGYTNIYRNAGTFLYPRCYVKLALRPLAIRLVSI
jgi:hypothetical protein